MKASFVMYNDWSSLVEMLSDDQAGELLKAIYNYHCGEKEKPTDKMVLGIYEMMCKRFDADAEKYEKICIRNQKNGMNGGRPKGSKNKPTGLSEEPTETQKNPLGKSGLFWVSDNDNDNDNDNDINIGQKPTHTPKIKFKKPTVEEIRAYCLERHNQVDAQRFFDFYESKGWKVGKNSMKDWKASVRTWEKDEKPKKVSSFNDFQQNRYDFQELESKLIDN